uniref:complement component C1q receptor-like n=1 Tax=Pristiophorus japonicus TaxID=55135 RepID=UPI00398EE3A5
MLRSVFILLWLQNYSQKSGVRSHATAATLCKDGMCYSLHWERGSFTRAKKLCEDKKGILTTMESQDEAESIRQLLANNVKVPPQVHQLWIGLHKKTKQCHIAEKPLRGFFWVNGDDHSTYSSWIREPPQTCTHERCVELQVNFTNQVQFEWKASSCTSKVDGLICKYQMCESLNTDVGKIVYKKPYQSESVPRGSLAIIRCTNGKSITVKCELQKGEIRWSSSRNLESLCNSCWEKIHDGPCRNGCFQTAEDFFCYCDKGFLVDQQQSKCVPEGELGSGFNESSRIRVKDTERMAASITYSTVSTLTTKAPTTPLPRPAENSTVTFSPTFRGSEPGKQETHSKASFLIYQLVIGLLVLMLLIAIAVIMIRERGKGDTQKTQPNQHRLEIKNTDSVHQVNENVAEKTANAINENHYVETASANENEVNVPTENGEICESAAH